MNRSVRLALSAVFLSAAYAQQPPQPAAKAAAPKMAGAKMTGNDITGGSVERGRYIVENVAMCWRCHTPGGDGGHPDTAQWLMGAPIRAPRADWAVQAPRIAGRPPGTDEQVVTLLTTGIARTGQPPRPPMPQFHMQRQDAESVLAYLKSLKR
jgi:mono/diheme cytochrome c family protein